MQAGDYPWHFTVQPYTKSFQVFKCPSYTPDTTVSSAPAAAASYMCNGGGSYQTGMASPFSVSPSFGGTRPMNRGANISGRPVSGGASLSQFSSSSQTILVLEHSDGSGNPDLYQAENLNGPPIDTKFQNHLGTSNYLFADGHVKSLKPIATITGANMWTLDPTTDAVPTPLRDALGFQQSLLK